MQVPIETVAAGLHEMVGQRRIERDAARALIVELVKTVYDRRIDAAIVRLQNKRDEEANCVKNLI